MHGPLYVKLLFIFHPIYIPPFERVDSFTYLSSLVTGDNHVSEEITNRLIAANRLHFGLKFLLKSLLLTKKTKIFIYGTHVKALLTHATETWTMTNNDERRLSIFERKILRRMCVGIGTKRIRTVLQRTKCS